MLEETINNNNSNPISALPIINNVFLRNVMASGKDLIFGSAKLRVISALSQPGIAITGYIKITTVFSFVVLTS
ncbi:hypothetical protein THII_0945 [Thioploca ingrica]|uniref:Uncharacterized protein n=1 Tax=Thioploca ingrica TaxID=40754 RepID=A0A090AIL1_9GAMM|nr:hypothetical protein THII_0945 [Thioploca ingrica]